jgi:nicotinamide mononucleotide transporter
MDLILIEYLEWTAIISGIAAVWFSKKEKIWVYPTGLVGTILYVYLSFKGDLYGEAFVNLYYTVMSFYGWWNWQRRDRYSQKMVKVRFSSRAEWIQQITFFLILFLVIYLSLVFIKNAFAPDAIPWADAFASASALTGMWYMTKKKVESWIWWMITNIASIPLYYVKGFAATSIYYAILLVLAVFGFQEWKKRAYANLQAK